MGSFDESAQSAPTSSRLLDAREAADAPSDAVNRRASGDEAGPSSAARQEERPTAAERRAMFARLHSHSSAESEAEEDAVPARAEPQPLAAPAGPPDSYGLQELRQQITGLLTGGDPLQGWERMYATRQEAVEAQWDWHWAEQARARQRRNDLYVSEGEAFPWDL